MMPEVSSSTVFDAPGDLAGELESLRLELESDILYCTTRDQHIRAVRRLGQVVHIIQMIG